MERYQKLSMDEAFLEKLTTSVFNNLNNEQFGAEELASDAGMSRSQIYRRLQKINGKSITQFIREIRLEEGHRMLEQDVGTVAEIAYMVGFGSPTYFNKCFSEYYKYTPGELKQRVKRTSYTDNSVDVNHPKIFSIHQTQSQLQKTNELSIEQDQRKLAVIMFTDIVGYTSLMGSDEDKAFYVLRKNREIHAQCIEQFNGTMIKEMGDGMLVSFNLASDAVRCAINIQEEAKIQHIPLKIGIHEGEMVFSGDDVLGDGVNIASRLQDVSQKGCITISETVYRDIKNKADIQTKYAGEKKLKNVEDLVKAYEVLCEEDSNDEQKPKEKETRKIDKKYLFYILTVAVIAIAAILIWYNLPKNQTKLDKSIAVIPFRDDSGDEDTKAFTNGVMEGIINNLANISELRIPGRTSVEQFRETTATIPRIGEKLNVSFILAGSVQKFGDQVVVNIQLLQSKTDELMWSDSYEYTFEAQFKIIAEIAENVAQEIEVKISPEEKQRIEKIPTSNLNAYYFYQKAREEHVNYWWFGNNYRKALERAEELYLEALENDSTFALAYIGLAEVYRDKHYWETMLTKHFLDSMLILADKALSFDNQLAEAYILRGDYFRSNNKIEQAIKEYDKAIKFNPNSGAAYRAKGILYFNVDLLKSIDNLQKAALLERGRGLPEQYRDIAHAFSTAGFKEKAHHYAKEALKLDGDSAAYYLSLAIPEDHFGNFKKAIELEERSYSFGPGVLLTNYLLGLDHSYLGQNEAYLEYMKNSDRIIKTRDIPDPWSTFRIGHAYWINGFKKEAEPYFNSALEVHNKLIEVDHHYYKNIHTFYNLATLNAFFGDKEKAFENLRRLNQSQKMPIWLIKDLKNDPLFENIRDDPEFHQIVKDVESKYQAEHERVEKWLEENDML